MSRQFRRQVQKQKAPIGGAGMGNMGMPNMSSQMGNIMKMQEMIQEDLGSKTVEGTSGGELVKVEMNGRQELISIKIDPSIVNPEEVDMLEDLLTVAFKDAIAKSQELGMESMSKLTGGLKIPGLF